SPATTVLLGCAVVMQAFAGYRAAIIGMRRNGAPEGLEAAREGEADFAEPALLRTDTKGQSADIRSLQRAVMLSPCPSRLENFHGRSRTCCQPAAPLLVLPARHHSSAVVDGGRRALR